MEDLDLRLVRYFVALAEELHFGRAAAQLFISQQTLSSQIARLESDLSVALLDRTGRQVHLTPAGQRFLQEARALLAQAQRSVDVVRAAQQVVRVASINDHIDTVPRIMDVCHRLFPDLRIEMILAPIPEQVRMVQSGELDLAMGRAYRLPTGLTCQQFRLDRAHVIASRQQPFGASDEPLAWRALGDIGVQVPPVRYAPQLASFLEELKSERQLRFRVAATGSTSLDLSLAQLTRDRVVQLGFDSFQVPADLMSVRLLVEPVALYVWSGMWRTGNASRALFNFLRAVRAASDEFRWMRPSCPSDVWLPAADAGVLSAPSTDVSAINS
jgi:DNA-binding transcriptional LysR family regulator